MNIHRRCQENVANNCGINTKQLAEILSEMGITMDKTPPRKTRVRDFVFLCCHESHCRFFST